MTRVLLLSRKRLATRKRVPTIRGRACGFLSFGTQDSWNLRALSCESKKQQLGTDEYGRPECVPAGELYIGPYHRSLRTAADALTAERGLIYIASALHGLISPTYKISTYDVKLGDDKAVPADRVRRDALHLGLDDADLIVLGGREYAELITAGLPHCHTPLSGDMLAHRKQCKAVARQDADAQRRSWWAHAARLFEQQLPAGETARP